MTLIILLFACSSNPDNNDTFDTAIDEISCVDGRGYEHKPGTFWQCDGLCLTCSCNDAGEIYVATNGPNIVTEDCDKPSGPQLPQSPK